MFLFSTSSTRSQAPSQAPRVVHRATPFSASLLAGASLCTSLCVSPSCVLAETSKSHSAKKATTAVQRSLAPLTQDQQILHVLNRLAFGARPGDVDKVRQVGISTWIEQQLAPQKIDDRALETKLRGFQTLNYSTDKLWMAYITGKTMRQIKNDERKKAQAAVDGTVYNPKIISAEKQRVLEQAKHEGFGQQIDLQIVGEMQNAKLLRAVESRRQLQEVLVDFWTNHFNLDINKQQVQTLRLADERDAIRPHVLGKFRAMLGASAHSPAMLIYLDNARSTAGQSPLSPEQIQRRMQRRQQNRLNDPRYKAKLLRKKPVQTPLDKAAANFSAGSSASSAAVSSDGATMMQDAPMPKIAALGKKRRGGINENYARELMELHTLGVNGGYTQKDVQEVARCFTGWSVNRQGQFEFFPRRHDNGEKIVLGHRIPAGGGKQDGERVLDILAKHPATARHISRKLVMRLVNDNPPATLVERAAQTFLKSDGDLRAVTKTVVTSPEFFAPQNYRAKIKSPFEYAVSGVRALGGTLSVADAERPQERLTLIADGAAVARPNRPNRNNQNKTLARQIAQMGQPLYAFQAPTGYPENSSTWVSSGALVARLNFALDLTNGRLDDVNILRDDVFKGVSLEDHDAMRGRLIRTILYGEVSSSTRKVLNEQVQNGARFDASKAGALLLGSPEFQRR